MHMSKLNIIVWDKPTYHVHSGPGERCDCLMHHVVYLCICPIKMAAFKKIRSGISIPTQQL